MELLTLTLPSGRPCLLMSHIPTQSGGSWNEMTGKNIATLTTQTPNTVPSPQGQPHHGDRIRKRPSTDFTGAIGTLH